VKQLDIRTIYLLISVIYDPNGTENETDAKDESRIQEVAVSSDRSFDYGCGCRRKPCDVGYEYNYPEKRSGKEVSKFKSSQNWNMCNHIVETQGIKRNVGKHLKRRGNIYNVT